MHLPLCLARVLSFATVSAFAIAAPLPAGEASAPDREAEVILEAKVKSIGYVRTEHGGGKITVFAPEGTIITDIDPRFLVTVDVIRVERGKSEEWSGERRFAIHSIVKTFHEAWGEPVGKTYFFVLSLWAAGGWRLEVEGGGRPASAPASAFVPIERDVASLSGKEAVFLEGQRAAVETFLKDDRLGRSAFSPIDAFNSFEVKTEPPLDLVRVICSPAGIVKERRGPDGLTARSEWRADAERPFFRISCEIRNVGTAEREVRLSAALVSNVGWVNKFAAHADDLAVLEGKRVVFRDKARERLVLRFEMDPEPDRAVLRPDAGTVAASQPATLEKRVRIAPGGTASIALVLAGSDDPADLAAITPGTVPRSFEGLLAGAARLECPNPVLEEFFRACRAWPAANVRRLPFGPPHDLDGSKNESWPVITASPDYHGIFANDCIQTLQEIGLLGPGLREASRNSVETMLRFGPKESVEWWTGDGRVWMFPAPLGDTPQVVLGACWHILWTGDLDLARSWWPDLKRLLAVLDANDADGDSLEDRRNTPYPEQPDPGKYNHEMLYVQCFWRQAYRKAADVAERLGLEKAPALAARAERIRAAIEEKFATPYGLGVWLDARHEPHPHIGHEQIIAAAAGDVSDARALRIIDTCTSPPIWTDDGPLRAEPGKGVAAGSHVWAFMRWKLVLAMLRLGRTDRAIEIAERWAAGEREGLYQAPEGFPTITGTTGKGYTWTAGRSMRALAFGLSGLDLTGKGVTFAPRLPSRWDRFALRDLTVAGTKIDLEVRRGAAEVRVDGCPRPAAAIGWDELRGGAMRVEITVP
jgi:hypothetical protein